MIKISSGYFSSSGLFKTLMMIFRRGNREILLKIFLVAVICLSIWIIIESRGHPFRYFSTKCIDYRQKDFSRQLNDRVVDYLAEAKRNGIIPGKNKKELDKMISHGDLVRVRSGRMYSVDRMRYSYPVVTPDSKILLDEIAVRFRKKTSEKGLSGAKFYVTSMTREAETLKLLRRRNTNTSENSPHLYGNTFDISYKRFAAGKMILTNCDSQFMKAALSEVLSDLRDEKKCWATYERNQSCFHVVSR